MSHNPRSAERPVKAGILDRRDQKAVSKPVKAQHLGKLDKGLKNY